jgi:hypothetical protein
MEAAGIARRIGRPDLLAQAALILECVLEFQSDRAAHQLSLEAMTALGAAPSALSARVTARFAEASSFLGENDAAAEAGRGALEMAEHCGDPDALKAALTARQLVCSGPDGFRERVQLARRMLAIGRQTGDAQAQMSGHLWLIDAAFGQGNLVGVAREAEQLELCVERVGGRLARWQLQRVQAALAQAQGRFADAHRLSDEAHKMISATGHPLTTRRGSHCWE